MSIGGLHHPPHSHFAVRKRFVEPQNERTVVRRDDRVRLPDGAAGIQDHKSLASRFGVAREDQYDFGDLATHDLLVCRGGGEEARVGRRRSAPEPDCHENQSGHDGTHPAYTAETCWEKTHSATLLLFVVHRGHGRSTHIAADMIKEAVEVMELNTYAQERNA